MNVFEMRLKQMRKRKGLSQVRLGVMAGFDESSAGVRIYQYENGVHYPDVVTQEKIAKALETPLEYFYCKNDDFAEIILAYPKLNAQQAREIKQTIRHMVPSSDLD